MQLTVRSDYDQLKTIAGSWRSQEEAVKQTSQKLKTVIDQLNGGQDWVGLGAKAFYQEMDSEVMPAMKRLESAMGEAGRVTDQIAQKYREAEDGIASFWKSILSSIGTGGQS
jgi:WXG100 family type VII secretion target